MAAISVTTTPVQINGNWTDMQNLGSVDIYLGNDSSVSSSTGLKIAAGGSFSRATVGQGTPGLWLVAASSTADVRFVTL